jgi:hypothetical protein
MKDLNQHMLAIEKDVYDHPDNRGLVEPALIARTRVRASRRIARSLGASLYTEQDALRLYEEACVETARAVMAQHNVGDDLISAREKEMIGRPKVGPWTWEEALRRAAPLVERITPRIRAAEITAFEYALEPSEEIEDYDQTTRKFLFIKGAKERKFLRVQLREFRPRTIASERGIRLWNEQFPNLDAPTRDSEAN